MAHLLPKPDELDFPTQQIWLLRGENGSKI